MFGRVIEIASTGNKLTLFRGFLKLVSSDEASEPRNIPIDDIGVLLLTGHGNLISDNLIGRFLIENIPIIFVGKNYVPVGSLYSFDPHFEFAHRQKVQFAASKIIQKQLWKEIISQKIYNQGAVLNCFAGSSDGLYELSKNVKSNDSGNYEAIAARRYWKSLFGNSFKRDVNAVGVNSCLNYGYAILRSAVIRSIASSGLNPALGISHVNKQNPFALADDLIEPFRPIVDHFVKTKIPGIEKMSLDPEFKKGLSCLLNERFRLLNKEDAHLSELILLFVRSYFRQLVKKGRLVDVRLEF